MVVCRRGIVVRGWGYGSSQAERRRDMSAMVYESRRRYREKTKWTRRRCLDWQWYTGMVVVECQCQ
jgi:hypothetical protein